jgi:chaperonin GroES
MACLRPSHNLVLVRRIEAEEKTADGIIILDSAKEKPAEGAVLAIAPGALNDEGKVSP